MFLPLHLLLNNESVFPLLLMLLLLLLLMLLLLLLRLRHRHFGDGARGLSTTAAAAAAAGGSYGVILLRRMGQQVLLEMGLLGEGLGAHFALMRPLSRVNLLVALKVGFPAEAFVALGTNVGGAVGEQVLLEMAALGEGLHADGAFVRPFSRVDFLVSLKIRLIAEAFVARRASKRRIRRSLTLSSTTAASASAAWRLDGTTNISASAGAAAAGRGHRRRGCRRRGRGSRLGLGLLVSFVIDGSGGGCCFGGGVGGEVVVVLPRREHHRRGIEGNV